MSLTNGNGGVTILVLGTVSGSQRIDGGSHDSILVNTKKKCI